MNILWILYIAGVGVNPGKQTVYHMCKTWLKKIHGGRVRHGGGWLLNKK